MARTTDQVVVEQGGRAFTYSVLAVLEFNSDRKRMSIIARGPDGRIVLYCKGADSIMYRLLAPGQQLAGRVQEHLDEMARGGYRTLGIASRELGEAEYAAWDEQWRAASIALVDREAKVDAVSARIETNLDLLGATAVEDKLQDGVPECLEALAAAGIKVWVLTGDKVETAISIAHSCRLFRDDMTVLEFREEQFGGKTGADALPVIEAKVAEVAAANRAQGLSGGRTNVGIVIEGHALAICLDEANHTPFLDLCRACKAVVCCRVTPMQKAQVTNLVKRKAGAVTLGIGDGANDVGMIRAAHIGVGISGREGRAAVLSSDYSFAQFRYLSRLLLLHGRWSFLRNREVVVYSFYKNWANVLCYAYLQFWAGFSSQPIFTTMLISTYNLVFTALPVGCYGIVEQDLEKSTILSHPETYTFTRTYTRRSFYLWWAAYMFGYGTWHSIPTYFVNTYALAPPDMQGLCFSLATIGTAIFMTSVTVVTLKLALRTHHWNWISHLLYWLSVALMWPFVYAVSVLWPPISAVSDMVGVGVELFTSPTYWLAALVAAAACLLPDIAFLAVERWWRPSVVTLLQEKEDVQRSVAGAARGEGGATRAVQMQALASGASKGGGGGGANGGNGGNGAAVAGGARGVVESAELERGEGAGGVVMLPGAVVAATGAAASLHGGVVRRTARGGGAVPASAPQQGWQQQQQLPAVV